MNLQSELKAAREQVAALQAEVNDLTAKLATAPDQSTAIDTAVNAALTPVVAELDTTKQALAAANDSLAKAQADVVAANDRAAKAEADAEKKVSARALEIVQKCGIDPAALSPNDTPSNGGNASAETLWAEYKKIQDPSARNAFYQKHRAVLNPYKR